MFHCFFVFFALSIERTGPVLTYISLLIIPCMIVYVTNNKEHWNTWMSNLNKLWKCENIFEHDEYMKIPVWNAWKYQFSTRELKHKSSAFVLWCIYKNDVNILIELWPDPILV